MLTQKDIEFIIENEGTGTSKLLLGASKYPDVNVKLCVNCIESRQKIKSKLPQWYSNPALAYPFPLSAEQCSSEATGSYKREVMLEIVTNNTSGKISGADYAKGAFTILKGTVNFAKLQSTISNSWEPAT